MTRPISGGRVCKGQACLSPGHRARATGHLDGLKVRVIDADAPSGADVTHAFRTLARMMVRSYEATGNQTAIIPA